MEGTYALLLSWEPAGTGASSASQQVEIGALGTLALRRGTYVYVGSAFGPGGLRARVHRHARRDGATHWHVDYLRAVTSLDAVWFTADVHCRECSWGQVLAEDPESRLPLQGFGASDCTCSAHLVAYAEQPSFERFTRAVQERVSDHAPIDRMDGARLLEAAT